MILSCIYQSKPDLNIISGFDFETFRAIIYDINKNIILDLAFNNVKPKDWFLSLIRLEVKRVILSQFYY